MKKPEIIPYGRPVGRRRKKRSGQSLMRVGGKRRGLPPRLKDKTFPVEVRMRDEI